MWPGYMGRNLFTWKEVNTKQQPGQKNKNELKDANRDNELQSFVANKFLVLITKVYYRALKLGIPHAKIVPLPHSPPHPFLQTGYEHTGTARIGPQRRGTQRGVRPSGGSSHSQCRRTTETEQRLRRHYIALLPFPSNTQWNKHSC